METSNPYIGYITPFAMAATHPIRRT